MGHALSADGRILVTHSEQGLVEEWALASHTRRRALRMPGDPVHGVAVSANADMVVAAGESGRVRLWGHDSTRARWVAKLPFAIEYLALSPDRNLIAVAGKNPDIVLLSALTGRRAGLLHGPAGESFAVAFSPDGKLVAACGEDPHRPTVGRALPTAAAHLRGQFEAPVRHRLLPRRRPPRHGGWRQHGPRLADPRDNAVA